MKIDEEPVDAIRQALIAFFTRQGGHAEVARRIGGNPQQLYYIVTGRNDPTLKTVMRILRHYPQEVELRRAMGLAAVEDPQPPMADTPRQTPPPPPKGADWDERLRAMEKKYEELQGRYDALFERYNRLVEMMMSKLAPSFKTAGSLSTVSLSGIGFRQRHQERDHTRTDRPAFRPLPGRLRRSQLV